MFWSVAGGSLVGKKGVLSLPDQDVKLQTMLSVAFGAVSDCAMYVYLSHSCCCRNKLNI